MDYFCGLIYGASGTGKTYFAGTAAQVFKTLHLVTDRSATDTLDLVAGDRAVKECNNLGELHIIFSELLARKKKKELEYQCVVLDSLTQHFQQSRVMTSGLTWDKLVDRKVDRGVATQAQYGSLAEQYRLAIDSFGKLLDVHLIVLCTTRLQQDPLNKWTEAMIEGELKRVANEVLVPDIETTLRNRIGQQLNAMGYTYKKQSPSGASYYVTFQHGVADTKLCGASIAELEDPTFGKVWDIIKGKGGKGEQGAKAH